jgi:hypothetical protein
MQLRSYRWCVGVAVLALVSVAGPRLCAAVRPAEPANHESVDVDSGLRSVSLGVNEEVALLRQAYKTLQDANHNYKGHRVQAMHHIQEAVKLLGAKIRGGGKGREAQGTSDAQLISARGLLESVRSNPADRERARVLAQVELAIQEIDEALKIK